MKSIETANLDGMSDTDLESARKELKGMARTLGATPLGDALHTLSAYAECALKARKYRLSGDIGGAVSYERACERLYAQLPDDLKW